MQTQLYIGTSRVNLRTGGSREGDMYVYGGTYVYIYVYEGT